ncbi:MAG: hypothetical protein QM564_12135 [Bergeyella sp.]
MKKIIFLLLLFPLMAFSQKVLTYQQVENTSDVTLIAQFIKENPTHPKNGELKRKMMTLMNTNDSPEAKTVAKPEIKTVSSKTMKKEIVKSNKNVSSGSTSEKNKKTAEMLTHLFNNDPNKKEAYIQIVNNSKCNMVMKISGKKFYNLNIPSKNQNFILVDKGSYTLTSLVCNAKYSSSKSINKDISITINDPK